MRLLVDNRWFGPTGIGRYANEILRRAPSGCVIKHLSKTWAIKNPLSPCLLGVEINRQAPELFWSPGFMPPMGSKYPYVLTVHDLIHLRYGSKLQALYYNNVIRPLLKNAATILTVSEYSRQDILNWSNLAPEKVISVYNGVSDGYTSSGERYEPGYQYLLYVGNKRQHKNLARLLVAFSEAKLPVDIKLVFTGESTVELSQLADRLRITNRLVFLGFVNEGNLPSLYRGALAVLLVSLYEGFGIPLIEGMACGVPVLASNVSALPEISGGAAYLVDPYEIADIASGIEKIILDAAIREKLIERGNIRSLDFSWDSAASRIWSVFTSVSLKQIY
jgi:glycosyltransferase involved in cell wall biosynthesis